MPRHSRPVPILTYHAVEPPPSFAPDSGLYVPPGLFARQLRGLAARGYGGVTLQRVYDYWHSRRATLPRKPVVVSFDDGYRSLFTDAAPVLRSLGWPGVLFLTTGYMGRSGDPLVGLQPEMVKALSEAGWEVDAHTLTHPDLTVISPDQLEQEVGGSRTAIQQQFGVPVNFFAYPKGLFDATVIAAVKSAGYSGAASTNGGLAVPTDGFALRRVWVRSVDGASGLAGRLRALQSRWQRGPVRPSRPPV